MLRDRIHVAVTSGTPRQRACSHAIVDKVDAGTVPTIKGLQATRPSATVCQPWWTLCLAGAMLAEQNGEWTEARRHMNPESSPPAENRQHCRRQGDLSDN